MAAKKVTKKSARKPASKAATKPKTRAKKKATARTAAVRKKPVTKKVGTRKVAARKAAATTTTKKAASPRKKPVASPKPASPKPAAGEFSSLNVNMGHVLSLRPRAVTSFRQPDFLDARLSLRDEPYSSLAEAARAVAEAALKLTHDGPPKRGFRRGKAPR